MEIETQLEPRVRSNGRWVPLEREQTVFERVFGNVCGSTKGWIPIFLLGMVCWVFPVQSQDGFLAEGMITPTHPTTGADIVVVQVKTAEETPSPPVVVSSAPPRLVLSSQSGATSSGVPGPYPQGVGRLSRGEWQVHAYSLSWPGSGGPTFKGFQGPASFLVTRGEVYPDTPNPRAGERFFLNLEGLWDNSCVPDVRAVEIQESGTAAPCGSDRTDRHGLFAGRPRSCAVGRPGASGSTRRWSLRGRGSRASTQSAAARRGLRTGQPGCGGGCRASGGGSPGRAQPGDRFASVRGRHGDSGQAREAWAVPLGTCYRRQRLFTAEMSMPRLSSPRWRLTAA